MSDIQDEAYSEAMQEISKLGDKIQYLEGQIAEKNSLIKRAAEALECFVDYPIKFVQDLRKAAE